MISINLSVVTIIKILHTLVDRMQTTVDMALMTVGFVNI